MSNPNEDSLHAPNSNENSTYIYYIYLSQIVLSNNVLFFPRKRYIYWKKENYR